MLMKTLVKLANLFKNCLNGLIKPQKCNSYKNIQQTILDKNSQRENIKMDSITESLCQIT